MCLLKILYCNVHPLVCDMFSECNPLAEISGGQYFDEWKANHTSNSTVRFGCYKGYNLNGNDKITCDTNGSWTPFPKCTAKRKFKG